MKLVDLNMMEMSRMIAKQMSMVNRRDAII